MSFDNKKEERKKREKPNRIRKDEGSKKSESIKY